MGNVSHAAIWDDSLLVDSWNEALEEYKHYHSIHARGERVQDILKGVEKPSNGIGEQADNEEGDIDDLMHNPHAKKNMPEETYGLNGPVPAEGSRVERSQLPVSSQPSGDIKLDDSALPQHLIGQVHNESLKKLLMSWYYAGYYTGLYEGQQQGGANKDKDA